MKCKFVVLFFSLFLMSCDGNSSPGASDFTVDVYIKKGNTQCNDDGLTLDKASSYLTDAGIDIIKSNCGLITGIANAAMCGARTNDIYIFSIDSVQLHKTKKLGFREISKLSSDGLGFLINECK